MISLLKYYKILFSRKNNLDFLVVLVLLVITGLLEVVGVASIMPFFAILMDPGLLTSNAYAQQAYHLAGSQSPAQFMLLFGALIIVLLVASSAASMSTNWRLQYAIWHVHDTLSERLVKRFLSQPFERLSTKDLSVYSRDLLQGMEVLINQVLGPIGIVISRGFIVLAIFALIAYTNIVMALAIIAVFGGLYAAIFLFARRRMGNLGQMWERASKARYHFAAEIFKSIKEIRTLNPKLDIIDLYQEDTERFSRMMERSLFLQAAPRGIVESVGLSAAIVVVMVLLLQGGEMQSIIPSMILFAVGGFRILPSLQMMYGSVTVARIHFPIVLRLAEELAVLESFPPPPALPPGTKPLALTRALTVEGVVYTYPGAAHPALRELNAEFPAGEVTAIIGRSGAGKSTLVDVMLGLLAPQQGAIKVDEQVLDEARMEAWRSHIGYVPQHSMILKASVAANIAFCAAGEIDMERVRDAARLAHIDAQITAMPEGYDTVIGDSGTRLSGGQRQRLVIARALYRDPSLLLMDEPTSALDGETQDAFIESINDLRGAKTIVIVSHSAKVARAADRCLLIDDGRVTLSGSPAEVAAASPLAARLLSA